MRPINCWSDKEMNELKVTFENGKIIIEGNPTMLYINENGTGCGQLFINGIREFGIIDLKIEAKTDDFATHEIKFLTNGKSKQII